MVITGVQFCQTELKPVRRVSADGNLNRFQNKVLLARRKPVLKRGEVRLLLKTVFSFFRLFNYLYMF